MKKLAGMFCMFMLFSSSLQVFAEEPGTTEYDYTNPGFKATVEMLSMEGHSNDDLASCNVKQLYYQEVGEMYFDKGMSKQEILDYYKNQLGDQALNAPSAKGFNLSLWITPFLLLMIISILIYFVIKKWMRNQSLSATETETYPVPSGIEQDIYDSIIDEERKKFL